MTEETELEARIQAEFAILARCFDDGQWRPSWEEPPEKEVWQKKLTPHERYSYLRAVTGLDPNEEVREIIQGHYVNLLFFKEEEDYRHMIKWGNYPDCDDSDAEPSDKVYFDEIENTTGVPVEVTEDLIAKVHLRYEANLATLQIYTHRRFSPPEPPGTPDERSSRDARDKFYLDKCIQNLKDIKDRSQVDFQEGLFDNVIGVLDGMPKQARRKYSPEVVQQTRNDIQSLITGVEE